MKIKKYRFYIVIFLLISIVGFFTLGLPSLKGEIAIQTYSDSLTYERIAKNDFSNILLFSMSSNVLGPVLILQQLDYNYVSIFVMNILLLVLSLKLIFKYYDINKNIFLFFILMSPLFFFSLFNINKEIFVLFDMALFLVFLKNKNALLFIPILIIAYFIRWQMAFFFIVLIFFMFLDKFYKNRVIVFLLFLATISVVYPSIKYMFMDVIEHGGVNNDLVQGSGIFPYLKKIQDHVGGYFLVFIPKLLQINIGLVKRIDMLGNVDAFWNYFVLLLHSFMSLCLLLYMAAKRKFTFRNRLIYIGMIYAAIFALTPIISVRYFLPMYILFAVAVSQYTFPVKIRSTKRKSYTKYYS